MDNNQKYQIFLTDDEPDTIGVLFEAFNSNDYP